MPRIRDLIEIDGETGKVGPVSAETKHILEEAYRERVSKRAVARAKKHNAEIASVRNRPI